MSGRDFDPDALRERYRRERDQRLRADANDQYVEVKEGFAHFLDDPYASPGFGRAPLSDEVEVTVVGGGFGGLLVGARLRQAGVESIRIIDPACVPHIGGWARHLYVFQRTPSSIDVKNNPPTDPEWSQSLRPGWHQARMDAVVGDPETAEALKPYYRQFCKRPCIHNDYLAAFNRPNVTLVDTAGRGVERITAKGVVVAGREYLLDCLIYASGFEVGTDYCRRAGIEIRGRGGRSLSEAWAHGVRTLHGMHAHGFPNCYLMSNAQAGFTANYPHLLNEQAKHLAYVIRRGLDLGATSIEVSAQTEQAWVDECIQNARQNGDFLENCTPGYYNNEGKPGERSAQDGFYGGGSPQFFRILEAWRAAGTLPGMVIATDATRG